MKGILSALRKKDFPRYLTCADKSFSAMCMVRNEVAALNRKIVPDWKENLAEKSRKKEVKPWVF